MNSFKEYIKKFNKDLQDMENVTHLSFSGGKYNIRDENYDEFYEMYYKCLMKNESMYIIEKINNSNNFSFFIDIEVPKKKQDELKITDEDVIEIINKCNKCINDIYEDCNTENIVSRRNDKYHINYPKVIVNKSTSKYLSKMLMKELNNISRLYIDESVYNTGLRLFGSRKNEKDIMKEKVEKVGNYSSIYKVYDILNGKYKQESNLKYDEFMKLVIRKKKNIELSKMKKEYNINMKEETTQKFIETNVDENVDEKLEVVRLLRNIKNNNKIYMDVYDCNVQNKDIKIKNMKNKVYIYVNFKEKFCPFYDREHIRDTSPIYIEITNKRIYIKCHDIDCKGRKYPDEGMNMPLNYENEYKKLYKILNKKYWDTELDINDNINELLEESLIGTHYKVAKVVYNIYKENYRIDDIKNAEWYYYNNVRWSKTDMMSINLSEEVKKYYNSIKISDKNINILKDSESELNTESSMKSEDNERNKRIDNIINKLENVSFKKSIMSEMNYLFKTLEPDFVSKLDSNPYLIGFNDGVYDLENNIFRKGKSDDYITQNTGYDYIEYNPESEQVKEIYTFLSEIIPNKVVREYLLKILGRSLLGINDEKFYIFTGLSGANGKSTLVNFLEYTLGDYATSSDVSLLTNKKGLSSSASPDVIRLKGKRLVSFAEPESQDTLKAGIIKSFSGGDTIVARELFKSPVSFKLQASMILCTNDIPDISSFDGGVARRLRVINFTSRFCDNPKESNEFKIDVSIQEKLKSWRPYFFSILVNYYKIYQAEFSKNRCIKEPDEVKIATNKYQKDNDKFNDYISENIKEDKNCFESLKMIYTNFSRWWTLNYSKSKIPNIKELRKALRNRYGEEIEKKINNVIHVGFNINITDDECDVSKDN